MYAKGFFCVQLATILPTLAKRPSEAPRGGGERSVIETVRKAYYTISVTSPKWLVSNDEYFESLGGDMDTLDAERIIIETDEENPIAICEITNDEFIVSDGYRVRIKPKQPCD